MHLNVSLDRRKNLNRKEKLEMKLGYMYNENIGIFYAPNTELPRLRSH